MGNIQSLKLNGMTKDDLVKHSKRYIKAIRDGRVICSIGSVSKSGMSRNIKFLECNGNKKDGFHYYNFFLLFKAFGFSPVKDSDYFRIQGCGMDMIFHTNYTIIRNLKYLGLISETQCNKLSQMTPSVI